MRQESDCSKLPFKSNRGSYWVNTHAGSYWAEMRSVPRQTFHCDDMHALNGIQGAQACIDGAVQDLAILPA
jgi:hypothetical protein